ncbi:F-box protein At1g47056-like [Gastrolobium bilobum]|uniref:F-box protein At1g47056-like n=1 Tax=Gastrolobium bilobum TaxID=150636 RepID=UPI002AAFDECD|nr:F-box protein At1g47056-like [Gastrolobium bilobum]
MGQAASTASVACRRESVQAQRSTDTSSKTRSTASVSPMLASAAAEDYLDDNRRGDEVIGEIRDYTSDLPNECLASVFQSLSSADRNRCSLVCRRWLQIEGQSRHRLSLNAQSDLLPVIPSLFSRFDSVTKLALKCDRRSVSIRDEALVLISERCPNLTRLKLRACRELTDAGMEAFSKNCKGLKKLSCGSCTFGSKGMNAVLDNCAALEELSVKRLRGISDAAAAEPIGPGVAAASLKTVCLKELYNGQCFGSLILGATNLRTLKLFRCSGDWDKLFQLLADRAMSASMVEVHLERLQISDVGLQAIANYSNLEILHLVKTPECTDFGLIAIAERCKLLRKLHVDGWKANRIGDKGLIAVAKCCPNLQELVLMGVNPTKASLEMLASNCQNLERLALCGSDTVGDPEISCIAAKCIALKKLCIKSCPVSDHGMEALASGCPNLVKVKVKKCKGVTSEGGDWLRLTRGSIAVNLDTGETEQQDASASDGGAQDNGLEFPSMPSQTAASASASASASIASSSTGRSSSFKSRLGLLSGRSLVASTWRRWSGGSTSGRHG